MRRDRRVVGGFSSSAYYTSWNLLRGWRSTGYADHSQSIPRSVYEGIAALSSKTLTKPIYGTLLKFEKKCHGLWRVARILHRYHNGPLPTRRPF